MTARESQRTALILATLALGAIALEAPAALAASPEHAKPMVHSAARVHVVGSTSTPRAQKPQPQGQVDDPFASLLLGGQWSPPMNPTQTSATAEEIKNVSAILS
jgi:hypothetical protein